MNEGIANSSAAKKAYIEAFVDKIYDDSKLSVLFTESRSQFKQYALDMFLYADISYDQIDDSFFKLVDERRKVYMAEKRKSDICELVEGYYNKYKDILTFSLDEYKQLCIDRYFDTDMTMEEISNAIAEEIRKKKKMLEELKNKEIDKDGEELANEEKAEVQEVETEKKPDDETPEKEEIKKDEDKKDFSITESMAGLVGVVGAVQAGVNGINGAENRTIGGRPMAGLAGTMGAVKEGALGHQGFGSSSNGTSPTDSLPTNNPPTGNPPEPSAVVDESINNVQTNIQSGKLGGELNAMLAETVSKSSGIEIVKSNNPMGDPPKQLVKVGGPTNTGNGGNQSGSVSIFAIGVAILSVVAFVLVAMILNVLLK